MGDTWQSFLRKDGLEVYEHKSSALRVLHYPVSSSIVTKVNICVKTPSDNDDGIPHALEHMIFMGSKKQPFKGFLDEYSKSHLCSEINAHTSHDHTSFTFSGLNIVPNGIESVAGSLLDSILNPLLPEDAFETEIYDAKANSGVMYQELTEREFDPKLSAKLNVQRLLYENMGSFNAASSGLAKNVRENCVTMEKIRQYHQRFYRPSNMSLVIVGELTNLTDMLTKLGEILVTPEENQTELSLLMKLLKGKDSSSEITISNCEDCYILTMAWEIESTDLEATRVLLELFRKNRDMLFSNFTYDLTQIDAQSIQVLVLFEDFEEVDEDKICMQMKKSIAEYMNQVDKLQFTDCIKNATHACGLRKHLSSELKPHAQIMREVIDEFLYDTSQSLGDNHLEKLAQKDFNFWFKVATKWARAPWAAVATIGSRKMYEQEIKAKKKVQRSKMVNCSSAARLPYTIERVKLNELMNIDEATTSRVTSDLFSHILIAYDVSHIAKEDVDYLLLIEILIAKAARKLQGVISAQTYYFRSSSCIVLYASFTKEDFNDGVHALSKMFEEANSEDSIDKIASSILRDLDAFETQDVGFWRTFLRFKHYKKLLKSIHKGEVRTFDKVASMLKSVGSSILAVKMVPTVEHPNFNITTKKDGNGHFYGYGHHRVNISDGIQSSHACIMIEFPTAINVALVCVSVEILNAHGTGPLWTGIRSGGMSYSCSVQTDLNQKEIVILLQDCGDVIKALKVIKNIMRGFATIEVSIEDFENAKKSAVFKYMKRFESELAKWKHLSIEEMLGSNPKEFLAHLINITFREWQMTQRHFSAHVTNGQNSNIVVMIPRNFITRAHAVKGLIAHGLDLFK